MEPIKIFISGDFAPRLRVTEAINKGDYASLFGNMLSVIKDADFAITNLEAPLAEKATPIRKTGPNLIAPIKTAEALKFAGFNMVTLANNHALDQGAAGLNSTISALYDSGIKHIGAGNNLDEAKQVHIETIKGRKIAFINCCENEWSTTQGEAPGCNPLNEVGLYYQIQDAKGRADYVILIIHGGHETYEYPSPRMVKLYRWFIGLGVDAVIGHHTHCYSGRELYNGKPIIYSLGNFIFDHPTWHDNFWTIGVACMLTINDDGIGVDTIPFHQCDENVGVKLFSVAEKSSFIKEDDEKTMVISDKLLLDAKYQEFLAKQQKMFGAFVEPFSNLAVRALQKSHLIPSLLKSDKRLLLLNLIRCEAHKDILTDLLEKTSKK